MTVVCMPGWRRRQRKSADMAHWADRSVGCFGEGGRAQAVDGPALEARVWKLMPTEQNNEH